MPSQFTRNNITANVPLLGESANIVYAFEDYHETLSGTIDAKANKAGPTFTGTATFATISSGNVTATTLATLPENTSIGSVSSTEISYLDGVTSSIQTQLNTTNQFIAPTGSILIWSTATAPSNWLICNGAAVSRTTYAALFAVIGTTYGVGDNSTTFNLPNLMGRVPFGIDTNQTEFNVLGETGGAKTVTLAITNLPAHTHAIDHNHPESTTSSNGSHTHTYTDRGDATFTVDAPGSTILASVADNQSSTYTTSSNGSHTHTFNVPDFDGTSGSTGSGTAFSILPPYIALHYIIKT